MTGLEEDRRPAVPRQRFELVTAVHCTGWTMPTMGVLLLGLVSFELVIVPGRRWPDRVIPGSWTTTTLLSWVWAGISVS